MPALPFLGMYAQKKALVFNELMLMLHNRYAFSETSGWRTARHNATVGGVIDSKHLVGLARDCVLDDPAQTEEFIQQCVHLGLAAFAEKDHIHVQVPKGQ